jgi:hypothetical protein
LGSPEIIQEEILDKVSVSDVEYKDISNEED